MISTDKIKAWTAKYSYLFGPAYFAVLLVITHFAWKWSFSTSLSLGGAPQVWLWSTFNCSDFFQWFVEQLQDAVFWFLNTVCGQNVYKMGEFILTIDSRSFVRIVWSCVGLKQLFIFTCIIAFYPAAHGKKLWFIPLSAVLIFVINFFRIVAIIAHNQYVPTDFAVWHETSKYVFYGILFAWYVLWDQKISKA